MGVVRIRTGDCSSVFAFVSRARVVFDAGAHVASMLCWQRTPIRRRRTEGELEALLGRLRYHYYLLTPQGPDARRQIWAHRTWFNWLFTAQESDEVLDVCRRLDG